MNKKTIKKHEYLSLYYGKEINIMFKTKIFKNQYVKVFNIGFAYGAGASLSMIGVHAIFEKIRKKKEEENKSLNND